MKQSRVSQLELELANASERIARVDALNALSRELHYQDLARAVALSESAQELAQSGEAYSRGLADSLINLSQFNIDRIEYADALDQATQALALYESLNDVEGQAVAYNRLGRINLYLGDYSVALNEHLIELAIAEKHELDKATGQALNSIGNIYSRLRQSDAAISYYERTLQIGLKTNDLDRQCRAITNMAICYVQKEDYLEAQRKSLTALELAEASSNIYVVGWCLRILGEANMHLGNYRDARKYMVSHWQHARQIGDMQQCLDAQIHLGNLEILTQNYEEAIKVLSQAVERAEQNQMLPHLYRSSELLSKGYKQIGDFAAALASFERYHQIKEKVFNLENEQKFKQLESVHQAAEAKQEAEIYRLKTIELEERVKKRTRELALSLSREAELNQLNARIIDNISHEFRTPLAIISATANMLNRYAGKLDAEVKEDYQGRIVEQVTYLDDLLDDITVVSRTNRQEIDPNYLPYSFAQLATELKEAWLSEFGNKAVLVIQYDADDHSIIMVDPILWQQIGHNLLSNSVKYGGESGDIQIRLTHRWSTNLLAVD